MEKNHFFREPSQIALNAIKQLCANKNTDYSQFEGNQVIVSDEIVTLYHGSKSGLNGAIAPISREHCDFGKGFYMGTEKTQPLTLICNFAEAKLYTLLKLSLKNGYDSVTFIEEFMNSKTAAALDDTYDRLQWAGYLYRYWHYATGESSKEIYKTADADLLNTTWLAFHTMDPKKAIEDLKEIYRQKDNQ